MDYHHFGTERIQSLHQLFFLRGTTPLIGLYLVRHWIVFLILSDFCFQPPDGSVLCYVRKNVTCVHGNYFSFSNYGFVYNAHQHDCHIYRSFAVYTNQTGRAWTSFNSMQNSFRAMWFPMAGILLLFAIVFVLLHAQRREYVTGGI